MALKNKSQHSFQVIADKLKKDIITSVGSMFVEIKEDTQSIKENMRSMESRLDGKINHLGEKFDKLEEKVSHLDEKVTWQVSELRKDIKTTMEAQTKILAHERVVKNHEGRLKLLEQDVIVLKSTL